MAVCPNCAKEMPEPGFGSLSGTVCKECEQRDREISDRKRERELRKELAGIEGRK